MSIKLRFIAPLFALGAIGAAITTAADASAGSVRTCADGGGATRCQSPGNVEIHADPPVFQPPLITLPWALG